MKGDDRWVWVILERSNDFHFIPSNTRGGKQSETEIEEGDVQ